ncbi:hypothetical protein [Dactylosporangium sp. NPDC050588]|uniref:hypothetical protein n=1 Tax=Dactylosporangium sp. NPDC050588 TaxID=3157211 RepID=UPI0033C416EC
MLDNVHAVENVGGDQAVAAQAFRLRQLGWDANASHPERGQGPVGWPPRDAYLEVALTGGDLAFIRDCLERGLVTTRFLVDSLSTEDRSRADQEESLRLKLAALDALDAIQPDPPA